MENICSCEINYLLRKEDFVTNYVIINQIRLILFHLIISDLKNIVKGYIVNLSRASANVNHPPLWQPREDLAANYMMPNYHKYHKYHLLKS